MLYWLSCWAYTLCSGSGVGNGRRMEGWRRGTVHRWGAESQTTEGGHGGSGWPGGSCCSDRGQVCQQPNMFGFTGQHDSMFFTVASGQWFSFVVCLSQSSRLRQFKRIFRKKKKKLEYQSQNVIYCRWITSALTDNHAWQTVTFPRRSSKYCREVKPLIVNLYVRSQQIAKRWNKDCFHYSFLTWKRSIILITLWSDLKYETFP